MVHKLEYATTHDVEQFMGRTVDKMGSFNELPSPSIEIKESEYIYLFSSTCFQFHEFRQVRFDTDLANVIIFWNHLRSVAVRFPSRRHYEGADIVYDEPMRYYRIGCTHSWRSLGMQECNDRGIFHAGNCYHVQECMECGYVWSYDTSD